LLERRAHPLATLARSLPRDCGNRSNSYVVNRGQREEPPLRIPDRQRFLHSLGCCWRMQLQSYAQIGQSLFENQELRDPGRSALTFNSLRYVARHGDRAKHLAFGLVFDDREGHLDV
jgi:hypothetical protein